MARHYILILILILIFVFISLYSSMNAQSGWTPQNSHVRSNLNSVQFIDMQTGICVGDSGVIIKTTNGGVNWIIQIYPSMYDLNSLSLTSNSIAYAVGDSGLILRSSDGGNSWIRLSLIRPSYNFSSVFFISDNSGYLGGYKRVIGPNPGNMLFKTNNGGQTWDSSLADDFIISIFFINQNIGWITKGYYALGTEELYKSTDAGMNWFYQFQNNHINSIFFYDTLYGWASGYGSANTQFRTINGGSNWTPCIFCGVLESNSLFFINRNKGWGASIGGINFTSNGGVNWIYQNTPYSNLTYNSVYFIDSLTGWVVGDSGKILKTTTGGVITDINNHSSDIPDNFSLSQNFPNPFNPVTHLEFGISELGFATLKVYDVLGSEVATLVNEKKSPGSYEVEFDGSDLSSGIYFYTLTAGDFKETKHMVLIK